MWLRKLWPQLGFALTSPTLVCGDKKACFTLCSSQQTTPMSKHIHIIHCWVSEKVEDKEMCVKYIASSENVSDILTKALFKPAFEELRKNYGSLSLGLSPVELEDHSCFLHMYIPSTINMIKSFDILFRLTLLESQDSFGLAHL